MNALRTLGFTPAPRARGALIAARILLAGAGSAWADGGVSAAPACIVNNVTIVGSNGGPGVIGAIFCIVNSGSITGGTGGAGGGGGAGVLGSGVSVVNSGSIAGGTGGQGGDGVSGATVSIVNSGSIAGGAGHGSSGSGVSGANVSVVNSASIAGGNNGRTGGDGVVGATVNVVNSGSIAGGGGREFGGDAVSGGNRIVNSGSIAGGASGANGGDGVIGGVSIVNSGSITGGAGGAYGGDGVGGIGLSIVNSGSIAGGDGRRAGGLSISDANLNLQIVKNGSGVTGADINIVNKGSIAGGLVGHGMTRADAIQFVGGVNSLNSQSGSTITGDVVVDNAQLSIRFVNATLFGKILLQQGATLTGSIDPAAMTIDATSLWNVTASSSLTSLSNAGTVAFVAPSGDPTLASGYKTLTALSYVGAGGVVSINTYLGADNSPTDKLLINGGSATGHTSLVVNSTGGFGALTVGNGIEVVEAVNGATTAPGAFTLGNRVAAGAYQYQLYDGGNAARGGNPADQNWYLRSGYRAEVPLDMAIPALASRFGLDMLGTYHDRVGEEGALDSAAPPPAGSNAAAGVIPDELGKLAGWGRVFGETGSVKPGATGFDSFVNDGPSYSFGLSGFQTGVDLYRRVNADGSQDAAGLYVGAGAATGSVSQVTGGAAGDLLMDGYAVGGYWTHRGPSGWYVDAVAQGVRYDNVAANSVYGEALKSNGWGFAASLEGGYPIALGYGLTIEPQAQAIYERITMHGGQDNFGLIDFGDVDPLYGRIGGRLTHPWALDNGAAIETWARADLWHAFGGEANTTFSTLSGADPAALGASLGGTWAEFGLGASSRIVRNVAVFASADYNLAVDGGRGHSYDGRIGIKVAW